MVNDRKTNNKKRTHNAWLEDFFFNYEAALKCTAHQKNVGKKNRSLNKQ